VRSLLLLLLNCSSSPWNRLFIYLLISYVHRPFD
jgi:hypothetical protein